jgi:hypothetical protein
MMRTEAGRAAVGMTLLIAGLTPVRLAAQVTPPELPVGQDDLVRVVDHPEDGVLEIIVGPVELPSKGPHVRLPLQLATLPVEGWAHGFEWEMRDVEGNALPDRLLHHWNFVNPDKREIFSPVPLRVLAAGRETRRQGIPRLLGMPIESGTRVLVISMFANPTDTPYDEAYLHISLDYTPMEGTWLKPAEVYPFYIDVMGPVGEKEFPLPPGRHGRSWEVTPDVDGRILGLGGHLHDFAESIRFEDVTDGKVLWEATPKLNDAGEVVGVPTSHLAWRGGIRFYRGHTYRFSVEYMNPMEMPAPDGAMGALGGILVLSRSEWPELDRYDEAYAQDLKNMLEKPFEAHGHGEMGHEMGGEAMGGGEMDGGEMGGEEHEHHPPEPTPL